MTVAPLDDPTYVPKHPPQNGQVPDVVKRWGARSQVRWFRRFGRELGMRSSEFWSDYYPNSVEHTGVCCDRCSGFDEPSDFWYGEECCCRGFRGAQS